MSLDTNKILDRRKLKRSRALWRGIAVTAVGLVLIMALGRLDGLSGQAHIATVGVTKIIVDDRDRLKLLQSIAEDPDVKALIVTINSPGGTVVGGESLYLALYAQALRERLLGRSFLEILTHVAEGDL